MEITTTPVCRFGWQGQTLEYVVRAEGASEIMAPEHTAEGLEVRVAEQTPTSDGVEARLEVKVLNSEAY